jgi:clan AA aspartic protease
MMTGIVNAVLEATLPLQVYGLNSQAEVTAVIDTGYNGTLTLPFALITTLALTRLASRSVTLGDASRRVLDFYEAEVDWDGQRQSIPVLCVEGDPLIGTALLKGYKMDADFVVDGLVRIVAVIP